MRRNTTFPTRYNTCPPGTLLPRMGKMSLPGPNGAGKHPQELTLPKIGKQSKILPKHPWRSSPAYYGVLNPVVKISHSFKHPRTWDIRPVRLDCVIFLIFQKIKRLMAVNALQCRGKLLDISCNINY